jgi:hypothetical protein
LEQDFCAKNPGDSQGQARHIIQGCCEEADAHEENGQEKAAILQKVLPLEQETVKEDHVLR